MKTPRSTSKDVLADYSLRIDQYSAEDDNAIGFTTRVMAVATLPHTKPKTDTFVRVNGNIQLVLQAPPHIGLPYGVLPRLIMAWVTREVVKTKSRSLFLGSSLSAFLRELDLEDGGGPRGAHTRVTDQVRRLFSTRFSQTEELEGGVHDQFYQLADAQMIWWHTKNASQSGLWPSEVVLSESFFNSIINGPIPLDLRALKALKNSSMALDVYTWLTYRFFYLRKDTLIPWEPLSQQFGADYARLRDFRDGFKKALAKVLFVYGEADCVCLPEGVRLRPSRPHVPPRAVKKLLVNNASQ